ncbi:MAG: putative lipid II flippase FtsW [Burkholderiales bacterium]
MINAGFYSNSIARPQERADYDQGLVWVTLLLLSFGLVMVYSASIAMADAERMTGHRSAYFLARHSIYLIGGICAGYAAFRLPMRQWQKLAPVIFTAGLMALILVLIPFIGREVNGSRRWISLVAFTIQPSEFMKLFAVLYAADYTVRKFKAMHSFKKGFLPMFGVMFLVGALLLREPDFGALVVISCIAMSILFLGGLNWRLFLGLILMLLAAFVVLIITSPYRMQRVLNFMDPWADPFGTGYQLSHALIAFGRGEWFGVGLGASVEKLFYLPEAHTDFLLAVIAEELGFAGVITVLAMFVFLIMRAFSIGREAATLERYYSSLVAQGIGVWLAVQSVINMGVNMGILPTKGLTLPFLSFGGSGIVANCIAVALLLRVDYENRHMKKGRSV